VAAGWQVVVWQAVQCGVRQVEGRRGVRWRVQVVVVAGGGVGAGQRVAAVARMCGWVVVAQRAQ